MRLTHLRNQIAILCALSLVFTCAGKIGANAGGDDTDFDPSKLNYQTVVCIDHPELTIDWALLSDTLNDGADLGFNPWYGDGGKTFQLAFNGDTTGAVSTVKINDKEEVQGGGIVTSIESRQVKLDPTSFETGAYVKIEVQAEKCTFTVVVRKNASTSPGEESSNQTETDSTPETTSNQTENLPPAQQEPIEVFDLKVKSDAPEIITVVWEQNGEQQSLGQKYNVYLDNTVAKDLEGKQLENIECASYQVQSPAGTHTVKVTAVLNGKETPGVTQEVTVAGKDVETSTQTPEQGTDAESASQTETESVTETETQTETESVTETETQTVTESEAESKPQTETESVTETETQTETESETESASQTETESETESETQSEFETESETESETKPGSEPPDEQPTQPENPSQSQPGATNPEETGEHPLPGWGTLTPEETTKTEVRPSSAANDSGTWDLDVTIRGNRKQTRIRKENMRDGQTYALPDTHRKFVRLYPNLLNKGYVFSGFYCGKQKIKAVTEAMNGQVIIVKTRSLKAKIKKTAIKDGNIVFTFNKADWKNIDGYKITYSTSSGFKKSVSKSLIVKKNKKTKKSYALKKSKRIFDDGRVYYFKVQFYCTVGKKRKVFYKGNNKAILIYRR